MLDNDTHEMALGKAIDWLFSIQDKDGSWKSETYGAMKQGAAMTSLVLYTLSRCNDYEPGIPKPPIDRAFEFLAPGTKQTKQAANPDGSLDNPVYGTAMYLTAARNLGRELDKQVRNSLVDFLLRSQINKGRGFDRKNPNYGGWDVLGPNVKPGKTAGPNISVTRFVLEALKPFYIIGYDEKRAAEEALDQPFLKNLANSKRHASIGAQQSPLCRRQGCTLRFGDLRLPCRLQ